MAKKQSSGIMWIIAAIAGVWLLNRQGTGAGPGAPAGQQAANKPLVRAINADRNKLIGGPDTATVWNDDDYQKDPDFVLINEADQFLTKPDWSKPHRNPIWQPPIRI